MSVGGVGLAVLEALWKRRPVVARGVGGIPMLVAEGETGHLVNSSADAAQRVLELLERPSLGERLGRQGQEHVRRNFLITRYPRDHLQVMQAVSNGSPK
jgi:glycosyltransferase involved in cell wall biosynthesis